MTRGCGMICGSLGRTVASDCGLWVAIRGRNLSDLSQPSGGVLLRPKRGKVSSVRFLHGRLPLDSMAVSRCINEHSIRSTELWPRTPISAMFQATSVNWIDPFVSL